MIALLLPPLVQACQRSSQVSAQEMIEQADCILIGKAMDYAKPPKGNLRTTGVPDAEVEFEILEFLKGTIDSKRVYINGYLVEHDDFNKRSVPYDIVRPAGLHGSCIANEYRDGALYLLFLKKASSLPVYAVFHVTTEYSPYWYPLGPTNEQLRSSNDEWVEFIRNKIKKLLDEEYNKEHETR